MTTINIQISQIKMPFHLQFGVKLYIDKAYLKEYYMLERLKDSWKQTAAAALMTAVAALPLTGNPAMAGEGQSGNEATPVAATNAPTTGRLLTSDIREESDFVIKHAPFSASNGRLAVIVYGSDQMILGAVGSAAQYYATKAPGNVDISFLWAKDNDGNADTALVRFFADGREHSDMRVGNGADPNKIMAEVYEGLKGADYEILKPRLAQAEREKPKPATQ